MRSPEEHYLPAEALQFLLIGGLPGSLSCLKTEDSREDRNRQTRSDRNFTVSRNSSLQQVPREEYMNGQVIVLFCHSADWPKSVACESALDSRAGQLRKMWSTEDKILFIKQQAESWCMSNVSYPKLEIKHAIVALSKRRGNFPLSSGYIKFYSKP